MLVDTQEENGIGTGLVQYAHAANHLAADPSSPVPQFPRLSSPELSHQPKMELHIPCLATSHV